MEDHSKGIQKYIKIGQVELQTPSKYDYTEADFDSPDSKRSETGYLNRTRIRRGVHTIKCTWKAITTEQLNLILAAVEPKVLNIYFFDPKSTEEDKISSFSGYAQATRTATIILPRYDSAQTLWSFECSFIEY